MNFCGETSTISLGILAKQQQQQQLHAKECQDMNITNLMALEFVSAVISFFSMHLKDGMQLCKRRNHLFIGLPSVCSFCFCHCISSRMKFKSRTHCTMTGTHTSECMCMFYGIVCLLVFQSWDSLYVLNAIKNGKTSEIPHFDGFTVVVPR